VRLSKTGVPAANRLFALPEKRSAGENMVNQWFTAPAGSDNVVLSLC